MKVEIVTPNDILSTGRVAFLKCETWGSHPAAKIQWFLDNEAIRQADIITNTDISSTSNMTSSTLSFKVLSEYDGRELSCKAMNPWFLNGAIEDNRRISVSCKNTLAFLLILALSSFLTHRRSSKLYPSSFFFPLYSLSFFFIDFDDVE